MKKSKMKKRLASAVAMLLISTMMLGTATYAWFSMNTTVTATGMQVKAKADSYLLINEVSAADSTTWDEEAVAGQSEAIQLRPTSTANTATWYTAASKKSNTAASASQGQASGDLLGTYTTLAATAANTAAVAGTNAERNVYYVDGDNDSTYDNGEGYYVKYTYYIKSSSDAITCGLTDGSYNLNIGDVTVDAGSNSALLDQALRVAVVLNGKAYIFSPVTGALDTYYVAAGANATTCLTGAQATSLTTIPAKTAAGVQVDVYVYFEGEDTNLKTDNITATLDSLTVNVPFILATNSGAATDNGVTVQ